MAPISAAFPFFSYFIYDPRPCSHLFSHNGLLAVSLGLTLPDSHVVPSLPSGLPSITVRLRKPSLTPCILIKWQPPTPTPSHSLSSLFFFISYLAPIICFPVYLFIVGFLLLEYEQHEDRGFLCSLLPHRTGP